MDEYLVYEYSDKHFDDFVDDIQYVIEIIQWELFQYYQAVELDIQQHWQQLVMEHNLDELVRDEIDVVLDIIVDDEQHFIDVEVEIDEYENVDIDEVDDDGVTQIDVDECEFVDDDVDVHHQQIEVVQNLMRQIVDDDEVDTIDEVLVDVKLEDDEIELQ